MPEHELKKVAASKSSQASSRLPEFQKTWECAGHQCKRWPGIVTASLVGIIPVGRSSKVACKTELQKVINKGQSLECWPIVRTSNKHVDGSRQVDKVDPRRRKSAT